MIKEFSGMSWQITSKMLRWSPFFQIEDIMADRPQKAISSIWKKLGLGELVMTSIWKNSLISSIFVSLGISFQAKRGCRLGVARTLWFGLEYGEIWWNMVEYGEIWWNMVKHGETWWNMVIYVKFTMFHHVSPCFKFGLYFRLWCFPQWIVKLNALTFAHLWIVFGVFPHLFTWQFKGSKGPVWFSPKQVKRCLTPTAIFPTPTAPLVLLTILACLWSLFTWLLPWETK